MSTILYKVLRHDDGWAYQAGGTYSETFASREAAIGAAKRAASEQTVSGEEVEITFEDESGAWHQEHDDGNDRPEPIVQE